jgi:DNA-binding winged helix-turn-helix (wHTH) protein
VSIEPRALRLIVHLLERRTRMVAKQELFALLWPGAVVSDATLSGALRDARRALRDDGTTQRWIQTRRKLGYRFIGRVELRELPDDDRATPERARCASAPHATDERLLA